MKFEGYHPVESLPIKRGDRVTIPKGTKIHTTRPKLKEREKVAGCTYHVTVDHVMPGSAPYTPYHGRPEDTLPAKNPSIRWAGKGGYWEEVDLNDVPEANAQPV
jgi:hypothetical protein